MQSIRTKRQMRLLIGRFYRTELIQSERMLRMREHIRTVKLRYLGNRHCKKPSLVTTLHLKHSELIHQEANMH